MYQWCNKQSFLGHKKNRIIKKSCLKKLLKSCENYENNQYFYEYLLYCAINDFLFEVERCYYWYCEKKYIPEKNSICLVCKFNRDLTICYEIEREAINEKSKIPKICRALMTFIYLIRYWSIVSPDLISNFNLFGSSQHRCFKYVKSD